MSSRIYIMTDGDAAAYIRTAFGNEPWRKKMRDTMNINNLVSALWKAQQVTGSNRLGDAIRWAKEVKRADDLYRR